MKHQNLTPTQEEIAEECAKIREGWSEQRWRNQLGQPEGWLPPGAGKYIGCDTTDLQRERS